MLARYRFAVVAVLAAALLAAALPTSAQEWAGKGRLQGEVRNEAGQPLDGVKITLRKGTDRVEAANPGPPSLTTNKHGKWSILGLAGGAWGILFEKEGYMPSEGQLQVAESGPSNPMSIVLKPIPKEMVQAAERSSMGGTINTGDELFGQQKWAEARAEYQKALPEIDAANKSKLELRIAKTYLQEKNFAQGAKNLQEVVAAEPNNLEALRLLAATQYELKQADQAIETLKKATTLAPDDTALLQELVNFLVDAGREEEAKTYLAKLPQGTKVDPASLLNIGIRQYNDGKIAEAMASFDRVIKENPNLADAYYFHGLAALALEKPDVAKADFQKLLEMDPQNSHAADARDFLKSL
jgi:Flp pilus assembly protein TadD